MCWLLLLLKSWHFKTRIILYKEDNVDLKKLIRFFFLLLSFLNAYVPFTSIQKRASVYTTFGTIRIYRGGIKSVRRRIYSKWCFLSFLQRVWPKGLPVFHERKRLLPSREFITLVNRSMLVVSLHWWPEDWNKIVVYIPFISPKTDVTRDVTNVSNRCYKRFKTIKTIGSIIKNKILQNLFALLIYDTLQFESLEISPLNSS